MKIRTTEKRGTKMEGKEKRYYEDGEIVWVIPEKCQGEILSIDVPNSEVDVIIDIKEESLTTSTFKLWEIDKLKNFEEDSFKKPLIQSMSPTLYFSKLREEAVAPSKRSEDLGYDLYASLTEEHETADGHRELFIPRFTTGMVPTGLSMAVAENWGISFQHERGSVGSKGIVITAGAVDSGYRDECFVCAVPIEYSLLLTTDADKVEIGGTENDPVLIYPVSKAIAQAIIIPNPNSKAVELEYDVLKNIPSARGMGKLGSTN